MLYNQWLPLNRSLAQCQQEFIVNVGENGRGARRRRSWYRRRLRMQRTLAAVFVGTLLAGVCWQHAARYLSLPSLHSTQVLQSSFWVRANLHKDLALAAARSAKPNKFLARIPGVYPYSVVPGGVKDPNELRSVAARDYVVRRHYAHFDYSHAHLVRASKAREVYLSYRIRNTVFWTRKRVRLHPGELLLTDGKITARARCGNQISEAAKPEVSEEEPDEDVLDQPVAVLDAPSLPMRPVLSPPDLPGGQPIPPKLFAGGFSFPYEPVGVGWPSEHCRVGEPDINGHCPHRHHKPPGPAVPEPSTMVLLGSGLALILRRYQRTRTAA
jgi:PEP-CTERM motif